MALSDYLPPTDNVYKFTAISGLLIIGSVLLWLAWLQNQVSAALVINQNLGTAYTAKLREARAYDILLAQNNLTEDQKSDLISERSTAATEVTLLGQQVSVSSITVTNADRYWLAQTFLARWYAGFGLLLSAAGFSLWVGRVQVKEDRLLALKIEKIQLECEQLRDAAAHATTTNATVASPSDPDVSSAGGDKRTVED